MRHWLMRPVDAAPLAAFRILFGGVMVMEAINLGMKVSYRYNTEHFHFTYPGFGWVAPLPALAMQVLFVVMGMAAFALALGFFYRIATALFLVLYSYVFLIDHSAYNNHYYLIILLSFLFLLTDAHVEASADMRRHPELARGWVPRWQLFLFRAQMALVYFFGGVAKINHDWLRRQPIDHWLHKRAETHAVGWILDTEVVSYLFAYGGLAFDLCIGPMLLWRKARPLAVVLVVAFHVTNSYVFTIGVFPWLGIAATILFIDARTVRRLLHWLGHAPARRDVPAQAQHPRWRWAAAFCVAYLAIQLALPFRHWLYPGNVHWTEEGHLFAWHMKLRGKSSEIRYFVEADGRREEVDFEDMRKEMTVKQIYSMSTRPRLIAQYARHLREQYEARGHQDVKVYADVVSSLNGRPYQQFIRPEVDLSRADTNPFRHADWIVPLDPALQPGLFPPPPAEWAHAGEAEEQVE